MSSRDNKPIGADQLRELLQQGTVPRKEDGSYRITFAMMQRFLEKPELVMMGVEPTLQSVLGAYKLQITTRPDGVKCIDLGMLEVDTDTDVDALLETCGLIRLNYLVMTRNFPFKKKGKLLVPVKLVNMGKYAQTPAIVAAVKQYAQREGNILELLAVYKVYPELAKFLLMVSLGSSLPDDLGRPLVPVLDKGVGKCGVGLVGLHYALSWHDRFWFVATGDPVNEPSSSASK